MTAFSLVWASPATVLKSLSFKPVFLKHALVGAGLGRDPVDAGTSKAVIGKFLLGGLENATPHALGVALPFQNSLRLGQNGRSIGPQTDVARALAFVPSRSDA